MDPADKKLLDAAAMAAGINDQDRAKWNPLASDCDALRLAVKLGISIGFFGFAGEFPFVRASRLEWRPDCAADEDLEADPLAATRRAIVRTAAEIADSA